MLRNDVDLRCGAGCQPAADCQSALRPLPQAPMAGLPARLSSAAGLAGGGLEIAGGIQVAGKDRRRYLALLLVPAVLLISGCSKTEEAETAAAAPVQVTAVTQTAVRRIVGGDGVLYPRDQAGVPPKIAAPVQKFYVNRGDRVKKGQLLAELENRDLTAEAAAGRGEVQQAESNLRSTSEATVPESVTKAETDVTAFQQTLSAAKALLDSREDLYKQGAMPRRQVDEARVAWANANSQYLAGQEHLRVLQAVAKEEQIKSAAAQVDTAKARHQTLEAQLGYSQIYSPISGVIADRPFYAGEMAQPGTPLLIVMDVSTVVARVNVPISQASAIKVGQAATVTLADSKESVPAKVTVVSPASDPASTTVQVWAEAENPGERLKPGASVRLEVATEEVKNAMVVPAAAILPGEGGGQAVLAVDSDSVAHLRKVDIGIRDGDKVQLLNGVRPGESVVIVGGLGVEDKAKVRIIQPREEDADDQ
jgi:HlyD family secretion protein